ncbi:MAG: hypothetical protein R3E64_18095 [Halioglobus sp.]
MSTWEGMFNGNATVANVKQILFFAAGLFCAGCVMIAISLFGLFYFFG